MKSFRKAFSILLIISIVFSLTIFVSAEENRIHAAYSFDNASLWYADSGNKMPMDPTLFNIVPKLIDGAKGSAISGFVGLNNDLFSDLTEWTVGFWARFEDGPTLPGTTLLIANGTDKEQIYLGFAPSGKKLSARLSDGIRTASCSLDYSAYLADNGKWNHIAVTYKIAGETLSLITVYLNGVAVGWSTDFVDLSHCECLAAFLCDFHVDELYLTNYALEAEKVSALMNSSADSFYQRQQKEIERQSESQDPTSTEIGDAYIYNWAAYLFDDSYGGTKDFHNNDIPCSIDYSSVSNINTSDLRTKFGYALIKKENSEPEQYITLDSKLLQYQSEFSASVWVYRTQGGKPTQECLFDFTGTNGSIRFAPYLVEANDFYSGYIEFTDESGKMLHKLLTADLVPTTLSRWVHYALTIDKKGNLLIYINGEQVFSFATGINPAQYALNDCRVVTDSSATDPSRTAIDEVYLTPKVLPAAEIRKIYYYGLESYTTQVLPDPGSETTNPEDEPTENDPTFNPTALDLIEDSYKQTAKISNGFIGTTFDDGSHPEFDYNNSAVATLTNCQLTKGVSSYGLQLDGTSFVRYPMGILDGVKELTISISYLWNGTSSVLSNSQRLFDFSRKTSSVASPEAGIFLEMGNGSTGLRFGVFDGKNNTYLPVDYNVTGKWTRFSATIVNGKITLYIDDHIAASCTTEVDISMICPDFNYVGKSNVRGDPLFNGTIDEVYIGNRALPDRDLAYFIGGIRAGLNKESNNNVDFWDYLIYLIIGVAGLLVVLIVVILIVTLTKKDKPSKTTAVQSTPEPVPVSDVVTTQPLGPRAARRKAQTDMKSSEKEKPLEEPTESLENSKEVQSIFELILKDNEEKKQSDQ